MTYTVYSKWPSQKRYLVERSYGAKCYAYQAARALRKAGKMAKVVKE